LDLTLFTLFLAFWSKILIILYNWIPKFLWKCKFFQANLNKLFEIDTFWTLLSKKNTKYFKHGKAKIWISEISSKNWNVEFKKNFFSDFQLCATVFIHIIQLVFNYGFSMFLVSNHLNRKKIKFVIHKRLKYYHSAFLKKVT